jgi:hypothetical protein
MVLPYPVVVQTFLSIDPAELDSCRLRLDDTDRIYFSTMMDDYLEVFGALKCRGRASVFELVGQTGITRTQFCRLFYPLTPLNSIADASFRMTPIGSTWVQWFTTTVKYLRRSRAGVVLSQLRLVYLSCFQVGQNPGSILTFVDDGRLQ